MPSRTPCEMAYHMTENRTTEEVKSMTVDKRSATSVIPTGASQPPTWRVWMPVVSAMKISAALTAASVRREKKAIRRCA